MTFKEYLKFRGFDFNCYNSFDTVDYFTYYSFYKLDLISAGENLTDEGEERICLALYFNHLLSRKEEIRAMNLKIDNFDNI